VGVHTIASTMNPIPTVNGLSGRKSISVPSQLTADSQRPARPAACPDSVLPPSRRCPVGSGSPRLGRFRWSTARYECVTTSMGRRRAAERQQLPRSRAGSR
jgi:hypothetical protein